MKKQWQVWTEGFQTNGQSGSAIFHGTYTAETFKEAVEMWINEDLEERKQYYNPKNLTYWGCKFFDNRNDAVRSFN